MTTTQAMESSATLGRPLSASGIVRSEWIKLRTVRSSMWCYALLIGSIVGIGALIASLADFYNGALASGAPLPPGAAIDGDPARAIVVGLNTGGLHVAVLIVAVLGCLIITGEYSTGMIRSTFAAAPKRTAAVTAKAVVLAATTFVATTIGIWLSAIVSWPILAGKHVSVDLGAPSVFLPLVGGAVYITMIALLAFGFGTIVRSTAGALATVLGLLLVAPVVLQLLGALTHAEWVANVSAILPQNAGSHLFEFQNTSAFGSSDSGGWTLNGWEGFAVLLAWVVVALGIALMRVKRRDA